MNCFASFSFHQLYIDLTGNEVIFSLETASDCSRNDKATSWGFRCSVVGYESLETSNAIRLLETELAYLGGMCSATLMKRDLALPSSTGNLKQRCQ